ncbi:MAG: FAD-binding oxidoreductase [Acidimicrobiales bacterium]|nr:FAD-binding oxidoreductase [Acidimicrobiales bacterium]
MQADAVVIGAGVIGSCVALELSRRGVNVVCVDKHAAAGYGSTSSSSAVIRFHYSTEAGVAMSVEGARYWLDWPAHIGIEQPALAEFVRVPMLAMKTPEKPWTELMERLERMGMPFEDLTQAQLVDRFPAMDFRRFGPPARLDDTDAAFWGEPTAEHDGAVIMTEAGYITDPSLAAQNAANAAAAAGCTFVFRRSVIAIDRADDRVAGVTLDDGSAIAAPVVVNVAGPHSSVINAMAGVTADMSMPTRPMRREVFVVPAPRGVDFEADGAMIGDLDVGTYFRPERGNNVLIGSQEPDCDELEWVDDPDHYDESLDEDEYQLLVLRTARRVRELGVPPTKRGLVSLYDATEDWTPIYDRSLLDGFYLACGTSGNQFKNAPIAGHCMAELITAVEDGHDHDAEPLVVTGKYSGVQIDLGTFRRRRVLTADSASTVQG